MQNEHCTLQKCLLQAELKLGVDEALDAAKLPSTKEWIPTEPPLPPKTEEELAAEEAADGGDAA
jgi:hypothetical protein